MKEMIFHFISHYGYIGIFVLLMGGMVGLPVPDEVLLMFVGFLVSIGKLQYFVAVIVCFIASILGMSISFFIGKRIGLPFIKKYGKRVHFTPERLDSVEHWFKRFGKFTITIGYFIPGVRHLTAIVAGINKWKYGTFAIFAYLGGLMWAVTFITVGTIVGHHWRTVSENIHRYLLITIGVLAVGVGIWWRLKQKRLKRTS